MKKTNVLVVPAGNPYINAQLRKGDADKALSLLRKAFKSVEQIGRKQLYKVGNKFYVLISSAPSNLKFDSVIRQLIKGNGKLPLYILFTRDVDSYPEGSRSSYLNSLRKVAKIRGVKGSIMGLKEFTETPTLIGSMSKGEKLVPTLERFQKVGGIVTIEQALREQGLKPKAIKTVLSIINYIK